MVVEKVGQKVIKNLNVPNRKVAQKVNEIIESGGGGEITVDPSLNPSSTNPVENKQIQTKFESVDNAINYHDNQIQNINENITEIDGQIENHGSAITQLQNEQVRLDTEKEERFNVVSPLERSSGLMSVNVTDIVQQDNSLPVSSKGVNTSMLNLQNILQTEIDQKQDVLTFDNEPVQNSNNPVKSGGLYTKQEQILQDLTALGNTINTKQDQANVIWKQSENQFITSTDNSNVLTVAQKSVNTQVFPKLILYDMNHTQSDNRWLGVLEWQEQNQNPIARLILYAKGSSKETELRFEVKKQDGTWKSTVLANNL